MELVIYIYTHTHTHTIFPRYVGPCHLGMVTSWRR